MAPPLSPYTNGIMPSFGVTVPPGNALNTTEAEIKGGLQPTFFADGCRFYVEAASVNGLISEILNAVNCMELEYDPDRLDNLCLAIKAATAPPNAETIVASICAVSDAQTSLANCMIGEIVTALCDNAVAKQAFIDCMFTNTLNMPEAIATCICSDGGDNSGEGNPTGYAQAILSACLISQQGGNTLVQGSDGRLYVPESGGTNIDTNTLWSIRVGIGQIYMVDTSLTGHQKPPSTIPASGPVFVELTSGLISTGEFNAGKISGENTVGVFPTNTATGVVSLASSPMVGETIHMINTEQAILRPRDSGIGNLQMDMVQWHEHTGDSGEEPDPLSTGVYAMDVVNNGGGDSEVFTLFPYAISSGFKLIGVPGAGPPTTYGANQAVRTGNETRAKNVAVRAYMRIR